jgi:hypothetical protein
MFWKLDPIVFPSFIPHFCEAVIAMQGADCAQYLMAIPAGVA